MYQKIGSPVSKLPEIDVYYEIKDEYVPFLHIYIKAQFANRHFLGLNLEHFEFKESIFVIDYLGDENNPSALTTSNYKWNISCYPISLFYEYLIKDSETNVIPYLGIGISFYLCKISGRPTYLYTYGNGTRFAELSSNENGWGVFFNLGTKAFINSRIFVDSKIILRHAEPTFFSRGDGDNYNFSNVSLLVGIGWQF